MGEQPPPPPPDWLRKQSSSTGAYYFFNGKTGESLYAADEVGANWVFRWRKVKGQPKPVREFFSLTNRQDKFTSVDSARKSLSSAAKTDSEAASRAPQSKWTTQYDPETSSYYYYDTQTGDSVWERPEELGPPGNEAAEAAEAEKLLAAQTADEAEVAEDGEAVIVGSGDASSSTTAAKANDEPGNPESSTAAVSAAASACAVSLQLRAMPMDATYDAQMNASLALLLRNPCIGFPCERPKGAVKHMGVLYPSQRLLLGMLLSAETRCVLELGPGLGKSTSLLLELAPNAIVFAVDHWNDGSVTKNPRDDHLQNEAHGRKFDEVQSQPDGTTRFDQFVINTWEQKLRPRSVVAGGAPDAQAGLVPVKLTTSKGLQRLGDANIKPEVIYIDPDHRYDGALNDIRMCCELFPEAAVVGNEWGCADVRRAATECAAKFGRKIHTEQDKCWTYAEIPPAQLARARSRYYNERGDLNHEDKFKILARAVHSGLADRMRTLLRPGGSCADMPIDFVPSEKQFKGKNALLLAASKGKLDCARALLKEFGANVNFCTKRRMETALGLAAYHGKRDVVRLLLECGANASLTNSYGETAHQAAKTSKIEDSNACAQILQDWAESH